MVFTQAEQEYLASQRIGRLATVAPDGAPQNNPVGFWINPDTGTIDIGGRAMGATRKFRNVEAGSRVALVIDEVISMQPWRVRGIEIRGDAEALADKEPPNPYFSHEIIRIRPRRIISWGIEPEGDMYSRTVE
jgi:pyridoxamine 5'-phosphate oxidase family protein